MDIAERLTNWGAVMRLGRAQGRAMSFEGRFRSPQSYHWVEPPLTYRGPRDAKDAWRVEAAWSSLPLFDRIILRGHYCLMWIPARTCRIAASACGRHCVETGYEAARFASELLIGLALICTDAENKRVCRAILSETLDMAAD
jgi:hypothetical protein